MDLYVTEIGKMEAPNLLPFTVEQHSSSIFEVMGKKKKHLKMNLQKVREMGRSLELVIPRSSSRMREITWFQSSSYSIPIQFIFNLSSFLSRFKLFFIGPQQSVFFPSSHDSQLFIPISRDISTSLWI